MTAWTLPALGGISSPYGPRILAGAIGTFHYGVDLRAKRGPVHAAQDGVVRSIWQTTAGAWVVDIRHPDEGGRQIRTRYVHMYKAEIAVRTGQRVTAGQQIGRSGASGTTAAHLHFEVLVNDKLVDPDPFMAARGVHLDAQTVDAPVAVTPPPPAPVVVPPAPTPLTPSEEDEMTKDYIIAVYVLLLGRMPDATGLADALYNVAVGRWTLADVEANVRGSQEFQALDPEVRVQRRQALSIW